MKQVKTVKEIKGNATKITIPVGTILPVFETHRNKYLVKYLGKYWFIDKYQAKEIGKTSESTNSVVPPK
jgi:hypothetical protein